MLTEKRTVEGLNVRTERRKINKTKCRDKNKKIEASNLKESWINLVFIAEHVPHYISDMS